MKRLISICLLMVFTLLWGQDSQMPAVKIQDLDKKPAALSDYYSQGPILVNFWSLSCVPCKKEMKYLDEYNLKYAETGFRVVSVNIDNPRSAGKVKSYVKTQKYSFPVLSDPKSALFRKAGGQVMPFTVLVDQEGNIIKRRMGYNAGDELEIEKDILEVIAHHKSISEKTDQIPETK